MKTQNIKPILLALLVGGAVALLLLRPARSSGTPRNRVVETLPAPTSASEVESLDDSTVFDLRRWSITHDTAGTHVRMYNRTIYRKRASADSLVVHYATGGTAITFRCPGKLACESRTQRMRDPMGHRNYAVVHYIGEIPIRQDFEVEVEADYVNGFRDAKGDEAATYTSEGADPGDRVTLTLLFPEDKPVKVYRAATDPAIDLTSAPEVTPDRRRIFWRVQPIRPNTHYVIYWTW